MVKTAQEVRCKFQFYNEIKHMFFINMSKAILKVTGLSLQSKRFSLGLLTSEGPVNGFEMGLWTSHTCS